MAKKDVIFEIFKICNKKNDFTFDNDLVKDISKKCNFGNPFDVTKIDNKNKLPDILLKNDYAIIHLGNGKHKFIKGIEKVFHNFEPVQKEIEWTYKKSLLNEYNTSESNILSVANNQRILHHFLFGKDREFDDIEISHRPKTYFPHRTKTTLEYRFGNDLNLILKNIQIEIDLTIEFEGIIGVFEAKNGTPDSFSIYQIYHPFLYYHNIKQKPDMNRKIKEIICTYVVKNIEEETTKLRLWAYTFDNPNDITSIKFIKSTCYVLKN
ncbi:MAG: hypothetical protein QME49_02815 [bacterium]|nr:hypothetical protein [bacterium]